jgi:spermidine/putrescine transport system ATP-binding protein
VTSAGVEVRGVAQRYGTFVALDAVSLQIPAGSYSVLLGPSGSGKTTLLSIIGGFLAPDSGAVLIGGTDVTAVPPAKRPTATVFQDYALFPHMTVAANVGFGLRMRKVPRAARDERVRNMLRLVGLEDAYAKKPHALSGGQRQRIALARVILKDAPILVLDEATSALDSEVELAIQEQLLGLMEGKTVIAIAHRLSTIARMDRLIVLDQGRIAETGTHEELLRLGGHYEKLWRHQSGGFLADDVFDIDDEAGMSFAPRR